MAFIKGVDTFDKKKLGQQGSAVIGAERDVYYSTATEITSYDPAIGAEWNKIYHIDAFDASDSTNKIDVFDGRSQTETKEGKVTSTMKITQTYKGFLNSIGKLKGQQLWFAECLSDDRKPLDDQGRPLYYEVYLVNGKLTNVTAEKGDAEALYKTTGEGAYNVTSDVRIFKDITPTTITIPATLSCSIASGSDVVVTAKDFKGTTIVINNLQSDLLMGEIASITLIRVSGTANIGVQTPGTAGLLDSTIKLIPTGTVASTMVIQAKITTVNGGSFLSNSCTVTLTA